jgi:Exopolyphosphatase-related proteins
MRKDSFFNSFDAALQAHSKFVVISHVNPDGDAIGSSLAFSFFLKKFGHDVNVMIPNDFPVFLSWMPGVEDITIFDKNPDYGKKLFDEADYICYLDFNHFSRSGLMHNDLRKSKAQKVLIDHHCDTDFSPFSFYLSETSISSTSELVAEIVLHYGIDNYLDENIATNLLVGIITDTGSFAHSIYHPETFSLCAQLVSKSIPYSEIHGHIYDTFSENRLRLLGFSISNRMEIIDAFSTAIIALGKADLEAFDYHVGDTEGIVNYPLSLEKIKMSVLITERQGVIRFSFRSKGKFSVHELALKYFNGGGHLNAAGGSLTCSLPEAIAKVKSILPEFPELLNI